MNRLTIFIIALLALLSAPCVSAQLPSVQLKDIHGRTVNVSEISNDGNPVVISFFATWCKPCMRELKAISEVYPDWQDETGMKMYIVSIDDAQNSQRSVLWSMAKAGSMKPCLTPTANSSRLWVCRQFPTYSFLTVTAKW